MNDPVLTLRWFLNCPEIDNLEFFGDEDCLGNPITGVNVIDNPEKKRTGPDDRLYFL